MNLIACSQVLPIDREISRPRGRSRPIVKMLLIMKLTVILILAACLQIHAKGIAQNITLSTRNTPLKKVLKSLQTQSGYSFFFEDQLHLLPDANFDEPSARQDTVNKYLDLKL